MLSIIVTRGEQRWELIYDGQWSKRVGLGDEKLNRLLEQLEEGVVVRTVVAEEGMVGHGVKLIEDVKDPDYMTGLRAALFEVGFKIEE